MKKINFIIKASLFSCLLFLASCNSDDNNEPKGDYENGILISGEGSGAGSGSISFISDDYTINDAKIYSDVNGSDLGTFLQSVSFDNDKAYIVVDNQNTVTVVDRYTFESLGTITEGLLAPRYMAIDGDKGYVTNWGDTSDETDDFIAVIDLDTFEVVNEISVGNGPERILIDNGNLYVSHKGAFTTNNIISVIDINTNEVSTITVNDNPDEMYINSNNELIVLSEGYTLYGGAPTYDIISNTSGAISIIDLDENEVTSVLEFEEGNSASLMVVENDTIYYGLGNNIYSITTSATSLSSTALFSGADSFLYGLALENDTFYTLDANFSDVSALNVFDLSTNTLTTTLEAPLGASKIYFN